MEVTDNKLQMNEQIIPIKKVQKRRCSKVPIRELPPIMPQYQHSVYPQLYLVRPESQICYKWDAIIVDLDRTVIHGKRLSQKRWRKYVENGTIPSLAENQTGKWNRQIHRKGHQMHPFIRGRTMIYYRPFVWHLLAVLDYLKTHFGTKIIICTKAGEHYAASVITALLANFTSANPDLIDDIYNFHDLTDDHEEDGKPKKPFRQICQRHNLDPKNSLIVDDNALSWFGEDRKNTNFWMPPCYGYQIHAEDNELQLLCKYLWDPIQQHHLKNNNMNKQMSNNMNKQSQSHIHSATKQSSYHRGDVVAIDDGYHHDGDVDEDVVDQQQHQHHHHQQPQRVVRHQAIDDDQRDREIVNNNNNNINSGNNNKRYVSHNHQHNGGMMGDYPAHYPSHHHWTQESDTTDSTISPKSPNDISPKMRKQRSSQKYLNINNNNGNKLMDLSQTPNVSNHSVSSIRSMPSMPSMPSIQSNLSNLSNVSGISNISGLGAYSPGNDASQSHQTIFDEQHGVYYKANMVKFESNDSTPKSSHTPRRYKLRNGHQSSNSNSGNGDHVEEHHRQQQQHTVVVHRHSNNNNTRHSPKSSITRTKKKNYFFESKSRGSKKLVAKLIGK